MCYKTAKMLLQKCSFSFHAALAIGSVLAFFLLERYYNASTCCLASPNATYTHIIVGAGTAGCVLAARLSENRSNRVLLVEAGGHFGVLSRVPLLAPLLQRSHYDWGYETEPQVYSSQGFKGRRQFVPRGKGLGGTGQINFMVHGALDEDNLGLLLDSFGSEEFKRELLRFHEEYYVRSHIKVHTKTTTSTLSDVFEAAIRELNNTYILYRPSISMIHNGERWSTFHSHLLVSAPRNNLHILCNTEVTKLFFRNKTATAIQIVNSDGKRIVRSEQVVLAAGAINTPKLLLLSGIGNSVDLKNLTIPVVADSPGVGLNLYDHLNFPLYASIEAPISLTISKLLSVTELFRYLIHKTGLWSETPVRGSAYVPPELNLLLFGFGSTDEAQLRDIGNYMPETFRSAFPLHSNTTQEGFVFLATCLTPKSRGYLKLRDANPSSHPIIDPKYLENEEDMECIKRGVKLIRKIINTEPFKGIGARVHYPRSSHCPQHEDSEDYLECIIRMAAITTYHLGGTCRMGAEGDALSVVDHKFRVKGVSGLRIVDASVLPAPLSGFPNSMITFMAEYAAFLMSTE